MKKDYYVKIKKKQIRKKLRSESGRRESPVFFVPKVIRQKFAFLEVSSIIKIETKKENTKSRNAKGVVEVQILNSHSLARRLY